MKKSLLHHKPNCIVCLILGLWISPPALGQNQYYSPPHKYIKNNKSPIEAVLREADFEKGDVVADIGAGNGWFDLALSASTDSLIFYLEEIDSLKINPEKLENDERRFNEALGKRITNTFIQVLGDEQGTGLKDDFFDQVLLIDTYHHFSNPEAMIKDIRRIIKPGGKLLVYELISRKPGDLRPGCDVLLSNQGALVSAFVAKGFFLKNVLKTKKHRRWQTRVFVFQK